MKLSIRHPQVYHFKVEVTLLESYLHFGGTCVFLFTKRESEIESYRMLANLFPKSFEIDEYTEENVPKAHLIIKANNGESSNLMFFD